MQEETQVTEDSLRQALARIGSGNKKEAPFKASSSYEKLTSTHSEASAAFSASHGAGSAVLRRRRFVGDGAVVVEHQPRSRYSQQRHSSPRSHGMRNHHASPAGSRSSNDETQELERLRQSLRKEQRKSRDVEAEADDLRIKMRGLETRIAHYCLQIEEIGRQLAAQQTETLRLRVQLREAQEVKPELAPVEGVRRRGRPRKQLDISDIGQDESNEIQPVQWWSD